MQSLLILLVLVNCMYISKAQPGTLDRSFGDTGIVISTNTGDCSKILIQSDRKIVSIGTGSFKSSGGILIIRYNDEGFPDLSFGDSGFVVTSISARGTYGLYGALQADEKILVGGFVAQQGDGNDLIIVRYQANGNIDSSFGQKGVVREAIGKYDNPAGLVLLPDGKIIVGGSTNDPREGGDNDKLYLLKYNSDGTRDESFGNGGLIEQVYVEPIKTTGLAVQHDGKIIIAGYYSITNNGSLFLKRYAENGIVDISFGVNGEVLYGLANSSFSQLEALSVATDDKIVVGGRTKIVGSNITDCFIGRFTINGAIDMDFGFNGANITHFEHNSSYINDLLIQPEGKISVCGVFADPVTLDNGKFLVMQYNSSGLLDSSFGINGTQITNIFYADNAEAIALQSDNKLIIGGYTLIGTPPSQYKHVVVARYNGDSPEKNKYVRIKHWLHHHGITWEDKPNNLINYYSIQRSTNGNAFTEVARIFSNHNGGIQTYTAASNATANYRVAAVSNTGNITYSNTLTLNATPTIQLYPNPAKNNLQILGLPAGTTKLTVTDLSGNTRLIAAANSTVYSINIAQLTSGNYLLHIKTANEVITKQFIKE